MGGDPRRHVVGLGTLGAMLAALALIVLDGIVPDGPARPDRGAMTMAGPTGATVVTKARAKTTNPFLAHPPFVGGFPAARVAARDLRTVDPRGAAALEKIARQPLAHWLGPRHSLRQVTALVRRVTRAAAKTGRTPVFVTYALPARDCGSHSGGGLSGGKAYRAWSRAVAAGIQGRRAAVIVEPDGLAMLGACPGQGKRTAMLRYQVKVLSKAGAAVYLDAGHSNWKPVPLMARRLKAAGVSRARGFAVNVANFGTTSSEQGYAERLSARLRGKHYVIDTSRNGRGRGQGWCNPPGRALGSAPRPVVARGRLDAYLWIKTPGLSDGSCNGGPSAGTLWPRYAIGLANRAGW